jgi:predicted branched-subunit amino acid permease
MLPLWLAAAPVAVAYAVAARQAGLSMLEVQVMSLVVFSAPVQLGVVQLLGAGAPLTAMAISAVSMMVHHILYGVSLARRVSLSRSQRLIAACFLTDGAYTLTLAEGDRATFAFLLGSELSMFAAWNLFTLIGAGAGQGNATPLGVDLAFAAPLTFFALLLHAIRKRVEVGVALASGVLVLLFHRLAPGGVALPAAIALTALLGALWKRALRLRKAAQP